MAAPPPDVAIKLRDGRFLHLAPLPFGALAGVPVGAARFDASGTRALVLAEFPGASIRGDWRSANPTFAYLIDAQRRTLTQLSADGHATMVAWSGPSTASVTEAPRRPYDMDVATAQGGPLPPGRLLQGDAVPTGSTLVSAGATDRLSVYKTVDGRYAVLQIGARRFRLGGTARNGSYAIIGGYLAWIDGQRHIAGQIARFGPDPVEPLSFAGSPYGDAQMPIVPLGIPVYQAAYRNGIAYFSFSYGVKRIVAATNDLINYWFPRLPHEPLFTVGDGLGASPDGALYFIRPEEDVMLFTRKNRYARAHMTGLDSARDPAGLTAAMRRLSGGVAGTALEPSEDALDTALIQWRFYPVGDASGERWIGSHLGLLLIGDRAGHFETGRQPAFPFAVLGRTDDGRLWGASPISRTIAHGSISSASSALWSTRDGATWQRAATISGDAGAVGASGGEVWVALTRPWHGRPMVWLWRSGSASSDPLPTGGTYAGEQLALADLAGGFYLMWGATPGRRLAGEGGTLSGFRIDNARLSAIDQSGENVYSVQRLVPDTDPSMPGPGEQVGDASALLAPSLALAGSFGPRRLTVRTNIAFADAPSGDVTIMSVAQERAFELKYAGRPYPLASALAAVSVEAAIVTRSIEYGPLRATGWVERWTKAPGGAWRLDQTFSRYSY